MRSRGGASTTLRDRLPRSWGRTSLCWCAPGGSCCSTWPLGQSSLDCRGSGASCIPGGFRCAITEERVRASSRQHRCARGASADKRSAATAWGTVPLRKRGRAGGLRGLRGSTTKRSPCSHARSSTWLRERRDSWPCSGDAGLRGASVVGWKAARSGFPCGSRC